MIHRFSQWLVLPLFLCFLVGCIGSQKKKQHNTPKEKFAEHVRSTAFRTPEEEQAGFTLPPGFEITLFASEPDISKPINMEFDDQGRLWVTQSSDYPMAASTGKGIDRITILEDKDGDGRADVFTHFVDSANIPIGIMPMADGAIAYSIPNLYRYTDTNNDGVMDQQKVLYGEFGHQDTHGMVNNLVRGFDGWIYACHGFTNSSTVAGTDGDSIRMVSGNTFRFRPDGSRIEQTSFGRVNPFGHAFDEWGYLYSADCHSKPIYQLIREGEYPHFGKKSPAIGFAPEMMHYELGSTAIAGLDYYIGEQFPEAYRHSFYSGDVVTCQINRNTMTLKGSTPQTKREEDFLVSDDPWFRPVDIKTGPDGAMYVADFYNRIIGHYEVPLNHPGRDRVSGRIWKITYRGDQPHQDAKVTNWTKASITELIAGLQHPQLNVRMKVADRLVDVWKDKAIAPVNEMMHTAKVNTLAYIQGLWILHRLHALPASMLDSALHHNEQMIQVHALRVLREMDTINEQQRTVAVNALASKNPHVQRIAAEVLTRFTNIDNVAPLLSLYSHTSEEDTHLKYTTLLSIRDNLRNKAVMQKVRTGQWNDVQLGILTTAMLDVPTLDAATFVLNYLRTHELPQAQLISSLEYIGRYGGASSQDPLITIIQQKFAGDMDVQFRLFSIIRNGVTQSGAHMTPRMQQWGVTMANKFLGNIAESTDTWKNKPLETKGEPVSPWIVSEAFLTDIMPAFRIIFSEKQGYDPTGVLYSVPFKLPASLSMNVFDNDVDNSKEKKGISKNVVRIRLAGSGKLVGEYRLKMEQTAQWKDLMKKADFDLKAYQGQQGYIEVLDSSHTGSIGIGKLTPAVLEIPVKSPSEIAERRAQAAEMAGDFKVTALESVLRKLVAAKWEDYKVRIAAANALMNLSPQRNTALLGEVFNGMGELPVMREKLATALGQSPSPQVYNILEKGFSNNGYHGQVVIATVLANSPAGIDHLLQALKAGEVNAAVISELQVKERLAANMHGAQQQQLETLTAGGANEREERLKLIAARLATFKEDTTKAASGKNVFVQNCSMCHQIKGNGGMVGPQLDGIGNWGPKALTEKILDPNRNISEAFRNYNITLKNGKTLTGLYRRTEGEVLVFADLTGKEFSVAQNDLKEKKVSKYTLMPDQFRQTIPEQDFYALLNFLISTK
jgi:putative membrane-bound dehydrogenase-like protein